MKPFYVLILSLITITVSTVTHSLLEHCAQKVNTIQGKETPYKSDTCPVSHCKTCTSDYMVTTTTINFIVIVFLDNISFALNEESLPQTYYPALWQPPNRPFE